MMNRIRTLSLLGLLLFLLAPGSEGLAGVMEGSKMALPQAAAWQYSPEDPQAYGPDTMFWRSGMNLPPGASPSYANLVMRQPGVMAHFQSNVGAGELFFVFGAISRPLRVAAAKVYVLSRSGSYSGQATIELWAGWMGGTSDHQISAGPVNIQTLPAGSWQTIELSASPAARRVYAGRTLLTYFELSGATGGNLDVRLLFEIAVTPCIYEGYLPLIDR
jgi:hypothetical protein